MTTYTIVIMVLTSGMSRAPGARTQNLRIKSPQL
jgi:hypothetical protein